MEEVAELEKLIDQKQTTAKSLDQQIEDLEKYHNTADGRVQVWFGLRTIFNNTDEYESIIEDIITKVVQLGLAQEK